MSAEQMRDPFLKERAQLEAEWIKLRELQEAYRRPAPQGVAEVMEAPEWAELYRLREAVKGPAGFETWQDAAVAELLKRKKAEHAFATLRAEVEGLTQYDDGLIVVAGEYVSVKHIDRAAVLALFDKIGGKV